MGGSGGMEKYGVDEGGAAATNATADKTAAEKGAVRTCPSCGARVQVHGAVRLCPKCGSAPFEKKGGRETP